MTQAGTTAAYSFNAITFSGVENETECPLVRTIEIYNTVSNAWDIYDSTASADRTKYPFISHATISTSVGTGPSAFDMQTDAVATYDNFDTLPTTINMRQKVADMFSNEDEWFVVDDWDIEIKYECDDDVLNLTGPSDIGLREYQIGTGAVTFAANIAQTSGVAGCEIIETHEIWDDNLMSWQPMTDTSYTWLTADPVDGAFTVNQAQHTNFVPYKDFNIRIIYTSKYSQMDEADRSKTDQFYLRIGDVCEHDTLTKNAEFADWTYIIWST